MPQARNLVRTSETARLLSRHTIRNRREAPPGLRIDDVRSRVRWEALQVIKHRDSALRSVEPFVAA